MRGEDGPGNRELPGGVRQAKADSELAFEQLTEDFKDMAGKYVIAVKCQSAWNKNDRKNCVGSDGFPP